jgi:hypothetical protein
MSRTKVVLIYFLSVHSEHDYGQEIETVGPWPIGHVQPSPTKRIGSISPFSRRLTKVARKLAAGSFDAGCEWSWPHAHTTPHHTPAAPIRIQELATALTLSALMDLYIYPLYVLVSKILSTILNSPAPIHPLYHPLSTLSTVGPTCHFI